MCFNKIESDSITPIILPNINLCNKCFNKTNPILSDFKILGVNLFAIYPYDDFIKENLYQLKGCFDIELAPIFLSYYRNYLALKYAGYIIVPAPSSREADEKRGFNHVVEIFKSLPNKQYRCIRKIKDFKQSDLKLEERQKIQDLLAFCGNFDLKNKKILIVDDVFTTGSTIKAMINIIKKQNPKTIKVLVMSKVMERK